MVVDGPLAGHWPVRCQERINRGLHRPVGRTADDPVSKRSTWQSAVDHLIAWDLPALDAHEEWKGMLYTAVDPRWTPFFEDPDADIDWRHIGWGGVFIDDRPLGTETGCPGGCS